jgi:hypothetical protein
MKVAMNQKSSVTKTSNLSQRCRRQTLATVNDDASRVRAVVLGRAAAFGADAHRQLTGIEKRMLCAAPIRPLVVGDLTINGVRLAGREDIRAPENMMGDDQRKTY